MYCSRCGTKNPDASDYCFNCGRSLVLTVTDSPGIENCITPREQAVKETSRFILHLSRLAADFIKTTCSGAFSVGALLGSVTDDARVNVAKIARVCPHTWVTKGIWQISPPALVRIQRWGREQGLEIVGFFEPHSEIDGLEPNEADIVGANWFGCSYLISDGKRLSSRRLIGNDQNNKRLVEESILIQG